MSLQLLTWRPDTVQIHDLSWRLLKRRFLRRQRAVSKFIRSQYYLTNAIADCRQAIRLNEDIAFAGLLIMAATSFAAISIFANVLYYFLIVASLLSPISGINVAYLSIAAMAVVTVLCLWVGAFLQNIWMYALYEGTTRKHYKSLRQTLRKSLRYATQTVMAWSSLILAAAAPGAIINAGLLGIAKLFHVGLNGSLPYVIALESFAAIWAIWVFINYSLLPQVVLFGTYGSWMEAARHARRLVSRKGRVFTIGNYLACGIGLEVVHLIAIALQSVTHTASTLYFLLLVFIPIATANACFTMLYRKRRLARS